MAKHKHSPQTFGLDMKYTGHDGHNTYIYGYRLTCSCGASTVRQFKSAHEAQQACDQWQASGAEEV